MFEQERNWFRLFRIFRKNFECTINGNMNEFWFWQNFLYSRNEIFRNYLLLIKNFFLRVSFQKYEEFYQLWVFSRTKKLINCYCQSSTWSVLYFMNDTNLITCKTLYISHHIHIHTLHQFIVFIFFLWSTIKRFTF